MAQFVVLAHSLSVDTAGNRTTIPRTSSMQHSHCTDRDIAASVHFQ
jgi:hypothetical protein